MNRRILKKHCKRAREILIAEHGYRLDDFTPSNGQESIDAPAKCDRRQVWNDWLDPGPLKGTPLVWEAISYYGDADPRLATDILHGIIGWSFYTHRETDPNRTAGDALLKLCQAV